MILWCLCWALLAVISAAFLWDSLGEGGEKLPRFAFHVRRHVLRRGVQIIRIPVVAPTEAAAKEEAARLLQNIEGLELEIEEYRGEVIKAQERWVLDLMSVDDG